MSTDQAAVTNRSVAKRQRLLAACILLFLCLLAAAAVLVTDKPERRRHKADAATFSIRPEGADREALIARYDARFLAMDREIDSVKKEAAEREAKLRNTVARQEKTIAEQSQTLTDLKTLAGRAGLLPKPGETADEAAKRIAAALRFRHEDAGEEQGARQSDVGKSGALWPEHRQGVTLPDTSGLTPVPSEPSAVNGRRLAVVTLTRDSARGAAGPVSKKDAGPRMGPTPTLQPDVPLHLNRAAGTTVEDYVPAGSFVKGRILTGVYAATGAGAASQPLPMVIRIEDKAVLPNAWRTNVTSCHVTASATGDLSSERVFVRLDRLSCVGRKGEALDVRVTGYAVGEDGKVGVRGKLVTRSGQAIASALSVGMLSGIGTAVSRSSEEITTSITGTQSKRYKNAWASGLGDGLSDAMDRITDYYLKLADRIFPVLEVDAGRPVDIVFSQGVLLSEKPRTR